MQVGTLSQVETLPRDAAAGADAGSGGCVGVGGGCFVWGVQVFLEPHEGRNRRRMSGAGEARGVTCDMRGVSFDL